MDVLQNFFISSMLEKQHAALSHPCKRARQSALLMKPALKMKIFAPASSEVVKVLLLMGLDILFSTGNGSE
jgi:hypothetical protein